MKEKVILFDGTSTEGLTDRNGKPVRWELNKAEGCITIVPGEGDLVSQYTYGSAHIHVEFKIHLMADKVGQERGNSGVYVQGCYEIQILDSFGTEGLEKDSCGAIYEQSAPLVNACLPPEEWQTYDIIFRTAKITPDGAILEPAVITVLQNGQVIHNNLTLPTNTPGGVYRHVVSKGPFFLQNHRCPVSFRNIWIQPLD